MRKEDLGRKIKKIDDEMLNAIKYHLKNPPKTCSGCELWLCKSCCEQESFECGTCIVKHRDKCWLTTFSPNEYETVCGGRPIDFIKRVMEVVI